MSALLAWRAFHQLSKDRPEEAIGYILGLSICLRIFASSDPFLHAWDERYHALVAKNLMAHPLLPTLYENPLLPFDYRSWGGNHVWLHKPPLALWMMAVSMKLFGVHEYALRLPSILFSTATVLVTYYIGRDLSNRRIGCWAAFLCAVNGFLLDLAAGRRATDHVDTLFVLLVALGIYLGIRQVRSSRLAPALLVGSMAGLALLTKFLAGLLVFPVWFVVLSAHQTKRRWILAMGLGLLAACVVYLPWQLYVHAHFPREAGWEGQYNFMHFTEVLEGHGQGPHYFWHRLPIFFGHLVYVPLVWFLYRAIRDHSDRRRLALVAWFLLPYVIFSISATKMPAYVMIAAPALFLIQGSFLEDLGRWRREWGDSADGKLGIGPRRKRILRVGLAVLTVLLLLLPSIYGIERLEPFIWSAEPATWTRQLRDTALRLGDDPTVLFNTERPIEVMFFTNWTAYRTLPSPADVQHIQAMGFRVAILDRGEIDPLPWQALGCEMVQLEP